MSKRKQQKSENQRFTREKWSKGIAHARAAARLSPPLWLFGIHAVRAALENPKRICLRLLATRNAGQNLPPNPTVQCETSSTAQIERVLPAGAVHQGVALLVEPLPELTLEDVCGESSQPLIIVLDQVTDPHNVGAILRSCAAFNVAALVTQRRHSPSITGFLAKAAAGALEHVPLIRVTNVARSLDSLGELGFFLIGLAEDGLAPLAEVKAEGPKALVLGAEGAGLRRLIREKCDGLAKLTTSARQSSLNVSNAVAVALYELTR